MIEGSVERLLIILLNHTNSHGNRAEDATAQSRAFMVSVVEQSMQEAASSSLAHADLELLECGRCVFPSAPVWLSACLACPSLCLRLVVCLCAHLIA